MPSPESLPIVILACRVLQDMLDGRLTEGLGQQVTFMDYGLHRVPANLTRTLQGAIDEIEQPSLVVLGYGLCGNGLHHIRAGKHTLLVPRVDDCIAMLLGSRRAYIREFEAVPGTYYLSKGWLESGSHPLKEYLEYVPRYGPDQAMWIMDQQYQHYQRVAFVAHRQEDLDAYRPQALEVARFCERWGMRYEEILGSDRYVTRLLDLLQGVREQGLAALDQAGSEFLVIPPDSEILQEHFMR
jgi:hypothetical protein